MNIAVITGASSGMGKEFVRRVDEYGLDEIWAIALEKELLDNLEKEFKTKIRTFALDLTKKESFDLYKNALEELKPTVKYLFNCSGFAKFGRYDEISLEQSSGMIDLNCKGLVMMSELTIPYMEKGGRILQIASVAAYQPVPYLNVYAASKAFVLSYARALKVELKHKGISVTCLCPFWTKTNFFNVAKKSNTKVDVVTKYAAMYEPSFVINKALKALEKRKLVVIPGFISKLQCLAVSILPKRLVMWVWCKQQKICKKYKNV